MKPALYRLDPPELEAFLTSRSIPFGAEVNLAETLVEVLQKANEFVPSDSGSILLADPRGVDGDRSRHTLTFIAAFGERGASIVGRRIRAAQGIAGHVYTTGAAHHAFDVDHDPFFEPRIDAEIEYRTRSVVAVPIRIANQVCGVLELLNRQETGCYSAQDRNLLEIFADYISVSVQNALDSRQAQELAKRDNLTELYNDRHLHTALTAAIDHARREGTDLALLFVDLDFFKHVNDSHGHLAGSQVLREVGRLLAEIVPEELGTAARYGGDEFVLTLPGAELEAAVDLAEEIRSRIETTVFCSHPGTIQPTPLFLRGITCSIGIATLSRHLGPELPLDEAKSTLLHLADAAMYVSKETGRNRTAVAGEVVRRRTPAVSTTRAR
jgi:diguanylate cyclase (GGDEF)-like protein